MIDVAAVKSSARLDHVVAHLLGEQGRPVSGGQLAFHCPFHEHDSDPSLHVHPTKDGGVWICRSCAAHGDVFGFVQKLQGTDFAGAVAYLANGGNGASARAVTTQQPRRTAVPEKQPTRGRGRVTAEYIYCLQDGTPHQKERRVEYEDADPATGKPRKDFPVFRFEDVDWKPGMGTYQSIIYGQERLAALIAKRKGVLYWVEGPGNAEALLELGLPATSAPFGAKKVRPEHARQAKALGASAVIVIADNDEAGEQHARMVADYCCAEGLRVKLVHLPDLPPKGDVVDFLKSGRTAQQLNAIAKDTPVYVPAPDADRTADSTPPLAVVSESDGPSIQVWPTLSPEATYGLMGDFVRVLAPHTEADPVGLLVQGLIAFGSVVGRGPHFYADGSRHAVNLNATLVGASSKGRKGTSWSHIRNMFDVVDPIWARDHVIGNLSSGEGLIWAVRDAILKPAKAERGGHGEAGAAGEMVVIDPGVTDKRLLVYETEFASILRMMEREGNTLSAVIRQAWDGGDLRIVTKNNAARATGAHISIVGHVTKDELTRYLSRTEAASGFANRYMWFCARRANILPFGGSLDPASLYPLHERFKRAVDFAQHTGEVGMTAAARSMWIDVYEDLSEGKPGMLGAVTSRAEAQTRRLACLYALLDCSPVVTERHLCAALGLWEYAEASARFIFGDALGDPAADEILKALRGALPEGLTRTDISALFSGNKQATQIARALSMLAGLGMARSVSIEQPNGGRPAEKWYAMRAGAKQAEVA